MADIAKKLNIITTSTPLQEEYVDGMMINEPQVGINVFDNCAVLLADPLVERQYSDELLELSQNKKIFFWVTVSAVGGVWFEYYQNGELVRNLVYVEGELAEDFGDKLKEEAFLEDGEELDESDVIELSYRVMDISSDIMFDGKYKRYV